jgi:hypothetical protein
MTKAQIERPTPMAVDAAPVPEQFAAAITPSQWTKDITDQVPIETPHWDQPGLFGHNTPRKDWSIRSEDDNEVRYELRTGETYTGSWPDQPPTERCEMGQHHRYNTRGNTFTVDYEWMVEAGPQISSGWLTCGQLHSALSASPPTEIMFHGNDVMEISANSGSSGNIRWNTAFTDRAPIVRGKWYKMRLQQKQAQDGSGRVRLWRDGELLCEYDGPVGYSDQTQTYWKQGVYRKKPDRGETVAMRFRNLKITEGLAVPTPPDYGSGGGGGGGGWTPPPEGETKTVYVNISAPEGVEIAVSVNDEDLG